MGSFSGRGLLPVLFTMAVSLVPAAASAQTATLAWDASADATGYVLSWGTTAGVYTTSSDVGNRTTFAVSGLVPGTTYYASALAYDAAGRRSDNSIPLQFVAPTPAPLGRPLDVNQDGRPDILWQHDAQGYVAAWLMNGEGLIDSVLLSPTKVTDTGWKIEGTGDFNGDGKPDLVWRHRTQGWLAIWLMDGTTLLDSVSIAPGRVSDPHWRIAAVADMNGDGKSDIVWQESTEGWVVVWLMNGANMTQSLATSVERVPDTGWRIVAAADMNGDGKQDLVWQHTTDGWIAAWLMDGTTVLDSVLMSPQRVSDPDWTIVGAADANGDGKADLYWQDRKNGYLGLWLMNGTALSTSLSLQPERVADTGWHIVGVR